MVDLKNLLQKGLKGEIVYQLRHNDYLRDDAQYDDYLAIEFDPKKVDYTDLVINVFPKLIEAFECYRATIYDKRLARLDWQNIVEKARKTGKDIDGRDGVYRINAVNYFDAELCKRAFGLTPEQIFNRLSRKVEHVSLCLDGVILIYSSKLLSDQDFNHIDLDVRNLLINTK